MAPVTDPPAILPLIADPHRWRLLSELAGSDRRVGELSELLGRPQNLVSYHLAVLRKAGIVTARRSSADGRDVYYRVDLRRCGELLGSAGAALHPALRLVAPPPAGAVAPRRRLGVLFLCTGNSARSQIAEALLVHRSGGRVAARSAGSHPKALHPTAVQVMAERGIDIAGHATTHLDRVAHVRFDRVVTLCDKVREICPEFPGAPVTAHWSIADPAAEGGGEEATYVAFQRVTEEIEARVAVLVDELAAHPTERTTHAG